MSVLPFFTPNYVLIEYTYSVSSRYCRSARQRMLTAANGTTRVAPGYAIITRALPVLKWGHPNFDSWTPFMIREEVLRVCITTVCSEVYTQVSDKMAYVRRSEDNAVYLIVTKRLDQVQQCTSISRPSLTALEQRALRKLSLALASMWIHLFIPHARWSCFVLRPLAMSKTTGSLHATQLS